jgi:hypothetical protein
MRERPHLKGIDEAYHRIDFHDWTLREIDVRLTKDRLGHEVLMRVGRPPRTVEEQDADTPRQYWVTFGDVRGVRMSMDLEAKLICSDSIASEVHHLAKNESEFLGELDDTFTSELSPDVPDSSDLKHFRIHLCRPGGAIELLAKSVVIKEILPLE